MQRINKLLCITATFMHCAELCSNQPIIQKESAIIELFPALFTDPIPTERAALQLFKQIGTPDNWTFLAVPWSHLINTNKIHEIPKINTKNSFTVCQHIHYRRILPLLEKMGVRVLFTPHVPRGQDHWNSIYILPFPHYNIHNIEPTSKKDVFFSFIGTDCTHPVRRKVLQLHHSDAYLRRRTKWHWGHSKAEQEQYSKEYQSVLARSRFSICPRGTGPSTIRFWESLKAGAIPVLLSDAMTLPQEFDWDSCIIRVPESKVETLVDILNAISPEQEQEMRKNCLNAFSQFQNEQFVSTIIYHLNRLNKVGNIL